MLLSVTSAARPNRPGGNQIKAIAAWCQPMLAGRDEQVGTSREQGRPLRIRTRRIERRRRSRRSGTLIAKETKKPPRDGRRPVEAYHRPMEAMYFERSLAQWIGAAAVFVIVGFGVPVFRAALRRRFSDEVPTSWSALVSRLNARWMRTTTLILGAAGSALVLEPGPGVLRVVWWVIVVTLGVQAIRLVPVAVEWGVRRANRSSRVAEPDKLDSLGGLIWAANFAGAAVIVLLCLQNLGVDVTALIAGLGIGGIAVALAVQNILGDLFASLTIALDELFCGGDFIVVGDEMGTVEHVGLKTTRVRSLSGEQLVFGNSDLLSSRIRNFKRMTQRRVVINLGVTYSTPPETLEKIVRLIREAIEAQPGVTFDRAHFCRFGASSLDFEAVYYFSSPDYNAHMDTQQAVHLGIARAFREQKVEFAFPTQTLYLEPGASPMKVQTPPARVS